MVTPLLNFLPGYYHNISRKADKIAKFLMFSLRACVKITAHAITKSISSIRGRRI